MMMNSKCFSKGCWPLKSVHTKYVIEGYCPRILVQNRADKKCDILTILGGASHTWWHFSRLLVVTNIVQKCLINKRNTLIPVFVPGRLENVTTSSQSRVPMRVAIWAHIITGDPPSLPEYVPWSNIIVTATRGINQCSIMLSVVNFWKGKRCNTSTKLIVVEVVNLQKKLHYLL